MTANGEGKDSPPPIEFPQDLRESSTDELSVLGDQCSQRALDLYKRSDTDSLEESLHWGQRAARVYARLREREGSDAAFHEAISWIHCFFILHSLDEPEETFHYVWHEIVKLLTEVQLPVSIYARTLSLLGTLCGWYGRNAEALRFIEQANDLFRRASNESLSVRPDVWSVERHFALNNRREHQYTALLFPLEVADFCLYIDELAGDLKARNERQAAAMILTAKTDVFSYWHQEFSHKSIRRARPVLLQAIEAVDQDAEYILSNASVTGRALFRSKAGYFLSLDKDHKRFTDGCSFLLKSYAEISDSGIVPPLHSVIERSIPVRPDLRLQQLRDQGCDLNFIQNELQDVCQLKVTERGKFPLAEEDLGCVKDLAIPKRRSSTLVDEVQGKSKTLWVEWCDPSAEQEGVVVQAQELDYKRVDLLRREKEKYYLYFDETERTASIIWRLPRQIGSNPPVSWSSLGNQACRLLKLVFEAFREPGPLKNSLKLTKIAEYALGRSNATTIDYVLGGEIRTLKSNLSKQIEILNYFLKARRGAKMYVIDPPIPYCWIRLSSARSILDYESPK